MFKVGDKIRRVGYSPWPEQHGYVGEVYTVLKMAASCPVVVEGCGGASPSCFELVSEAPVIKPLKDFDVKVGDKFICREPHKRYGDRVWTAVKRHGKIIIEHEVGWNPTSCDWLYERIEIMEYEDEWHINDGSPIPEGADTLEKDGSVVAYRKVKEPEVLLFGELSREEKAELLLHVYVDGGTCEFYSELKGGWVPTCLNFKSGKKYRKAKG